MHKLDLIKRRIETEAVNRIEKGRRRRGEAFKEKKNYEFHVGDLVLITNEANHPGLNKKLEPKFIGPYRIERTVGTRNYMIKKVDGPYQKVVHHCRIVPYIPRHPINSEQTIRSSNNTAIIN